MHCWLQRYEGVAQFIATNVTNSNHIRKGQFEILKLL